MRGEEKANYLGVIDKKIISSIKEGAWTEVGAHIAGIKKWLSELEPSKSDKNWKPDGNQIAPAGQPEKKLALAVAEGFVGGEFMAELPTALGLGGNKDLRGVDLARVSGQELYVFEFKMGGTGEDIYKGLRQLIVHSTLYQAFLENPRKFGYNTETSPLLLSEPLLSWELVGPKDMINPRRSEMRWGERDTQEMQKIMKTLGVNSFSLGRLQAEAEALKNGIEKDNFSPARARQWFENRSTVLVAG